MDKIKASTLADLAYYCRKRLIPSAYQQVSYLENSGTQYIITPVIPYPTTVTEITFSLNSPDYTNLFLFGALGSGGSIWTTNYWCQIKTSSTIDLANGLTVGRLYNVSFLSGANEIYYTSEDIRLNGSTIGTPATSFNSNYPSPIWIWGRHLNGNAQPISSGGLRIHRAKFTYSETSEVVCDLYPCVRQSDSKPGMYDTITGTFFTNAGSGDFTAGGAV